MHAFTEKTLLRFPGAQIPVEKRYLSKSAPAGLWGSWEKGPFQFLRSQPVPPDFLPLPFDPCLSHFQFISGKSSLGSFLSIFPVTECIVCFLHPQRLYYQRSIYLFLIQGEPTISQQCHRINFSTSLMRTASLLYLTRRLSPVLQKEPYKDLPCPLLNAKGNTADGVNICRGRKHTHFSKSREARLWACASGWSREKAMSLSGFLCSLQAASAKAVFSTFASSLAEASFPLPDPNLRRSSPDKVK